PSSTITRPCDMSIDQHCVLLLPVPWLLGPLQTIPVLRKTRCKATRRLPSDSLSESQAWKTARWMRQTPLGASHRTSLRDRPMSQCDQLRTSGCPTGIDWTPRLLPSPFSPGPCARSRTPIVPARRRPDVGFHE